MSGVQRVSFGKRKWGRQKSANSSAAFERVRLSTFRTFVFLAVYAMNGHAPVPFCDATTLHARLAQKG